MQEEAAKRLEEQQIWQEQLRREREAKEREMEAQDLVRMRVLTEFYTNLDFCVSLGFFVN